MSAMLRLPVEILCVLATLLESDELDRLAGACRAARDSVVFNAPARKSLVLPPTDRDHAHRLLTAILGRDPAWLAGLAWIQIATPGHVDLLVECGGSAFVQSVRVRTEIDHSTDVVHMICDKLRVLPNVTALDLSDTAIRDLSFVAEMTQLRRIVLNRTEIRNAAPLASLVNLEELELLNGRVLDMSCVENMTKLQRLEATHAHGSNVSLPPLLKHSNLRALRVGKISISSAADFSGSLTNLRRLTSLDLYARSVDAGANPHLSPTHVPLEMVAQDDPRLELPRSADLITKVLSLRLVHDKVARDLEALAALARLEQLSICLPRTVGRTDYRFLLTMTSLKKISIGIQSYQDDNAAAQEMKTILAVLAMMPQLERLVIQSVKANRGIGEALPSLTQLKHLTFQARNLACLEQIKLLCHSLRSLKIKVDASAIDVSAIGCLIHLEALTLIDKTSSQNRPHDFPFLSQLTSLRTLTLDGMIGDLASLRTLRNLRELTIRSKSAYRLMNAGILGELKALQKLDITSATITDLTPLMRLTALRWLAISPNADCRVVSKGNHPSLLRVLHPYKNCLWSCSYGTILEDEEIP